MDPRETTLVRFPLIRRFPNGAPLAVGVVLATGIAGLDWWSGPAYSLSLLYVLAVMAVSWIGTRRHGIVVAALAAGEQMIAGSGVTVLARLWNSVMLGGVLMIVAVMLCSLRRSLVDQRRHATIDNLTGAMNRRSFAIIAERERLRAGRDGSPLTMAYFDIDAFKTVNDAHGHALGDRILEAFAEAVESTIRGTDLFARLGGDEFVLLLPDTDAHRAMVAVDRVRQRLAATCVVDGSPLTTSVGVATFRFPPHSVDAMIAGADELMYQAKQRGGDTVVGMVFIGPWARWSDTMAAGEPHLVPAQRLPVDVR
ncbi:MAG: diguanylate cyclase [Acidimicrobiia bacterium]|nr:MAG: diguanylate cyclase [Acidimicrobiia bacterium]